MKGAQGWMEQELVATLAERGGRRAGEEEVGWWQLSCSQALRSCTCWQGRSVRDGTLRRVQRRSFTPASFLEEDTVEFPEELDTSFFARVSAAVGRGLGWGVTHLPSVAASPPDLQCLLRKVSSTRSCPRTQMKCSSLPRRQHSRTGRKAQSKRVSREALWTAMSWSGAT